MLPGPAILRGVIFAMGIVMAAVLSGAENAKPKKPPPPTDWLEWNDVVRFRGQFQATREQRKFSVDAIGDVVRLHYVLTLNGTFVMERRPGGGWDAKDGWINGSYGGFNESHRRNRHGRNTRTAVISGASKHFELRVWPKQGTWEFQSYGETDEKVPQRTTLDDREWKFLEHNWGWKEEHRDETSPTLYPAGGTFRGELPRGKPVMLSAQIDELTGKIDRDKGEAHLVARVLLVPEFKDLELIVEVEGRTGDGSAVGYGEWIPRGTPSGAAGSSLLVRARLQSADGSPVKAKVDHFAFELRDTSREPGVCLNFPLPPDNPPPSFTAPDLQFLPAGAIDADRQRSEVKPALDPDGYPSAQATIQCFDYGAWSNLLVTAKLADGRTVTGHLKSEPGIMLITLPKRSNGSLIADAWKKQHDLTGSEVDDDETLPDAGKAPGDGFTVYEEYRGFIEGGRHVEGDPKKIDFFVRNFIGADAKPGLALFSRVTGAQLHTDLLEAEFDPYERVMNINHGQAPHAVDQHGVLVYERDIDGSMTNLTLENVRGRPGLCKNILIQPRRKVTTTTVNDNLPPADLAITYDRMIAHELLHAVGAEHHGFGDGAARFHFIFADDPRNPTGKPVFFMGMLGAHTIVTVLDEATGRDLAEMWAPALIAERERDRPREYPLALIRETKYWESQPSSARQYTDEQYAQIALNNAYGAHSWFVGVEHGLCSGDENCLMRYYYAKAYEKTGSNKKVFYYVSATQTERAGLGLCRAAAGTGINQAGRQPQSRYGDARPGWGPCADWLVFNDAVPPDPDPQ